MRFEAIRKIHPTVVTLRGENEASEQDGTIVTLNEELIALEVAKMVQEADDAKVIKDAKDAKTMALDTLEITHNTVAYDANGTAIGNMSAVMGIANFKYNQLISIGMLDNVTGNYVALPALEAYNYVYKSKIFWRGVDNASHEVMIESVCEALEKSMLEVANILGV